MDTIDRSLINRLQDGLPIVEEPFAEVGRELDLDEQQVIARLEALLSDGMLSRFGPMFHAERMGGAFVLAALSVPGDQFEIVAEIVNAQPEVAHNYARDHTLNMWFVLATERPQEIDDVVRRIEGLTGLDVFAFPKLEEYFVGLRFEA